MVGSHGHISFEWSIVVQVPGGTFEFHSHAASAAQVAAPAVQVAASAAQVASSAAQVAASAAQLGHLTSQRLPACYEITLSYFHRRVLHLQRQNRVARQI